MAEDQQGQRVVCDSCCQREIPYDLLRIHEQLTPSDLKKNMKNDSFMEVYSRTCTPIQKTLIGCDKSLQGPEDLWLDPEDRTVNEEGKARVKLTPLINVEKVKALTHFGILKIGGEIEKKIDDENSKLIERAINETLEVAKFEADARIKFHIESVTRKLNAEWKTRMDELRAQLEEGKPSLIKFYENGVTEVTENENGCQRCEVEDYSSGSSIDSRFNRAVVNNDKQMKKTMQVSTRRIRSDGASEEESHYSPAASNHDQMENTRLINSERCNEENDDKIEKMKNECLKALDLQSELMLCRHITEIVHMMAVIRQQDKTRTHPANLRNDVNGSHQHEEDSRMNANKFHAETRNHQSKSINLPSAENDELQPKINKSNEEKITDELKSKPQSKRRSIDYDGQGGNSSDPQVEPEKHKYHTSYSRSSWNGNNDGSKWDSESSKQSMIRNSFVDGVLNRFVSHHTSSSMATIEPFSSQRENDYEKKSNPPPSMETMGREKAAFDPSTADVDVFLLPKAANAATAVSRIEDSLETSSLPTSQRFVPKSGVSTKDEHNNLLASVDSLEVLAHHAKHLENMQSSSNLSKKTEKAEVARERTMRAITPAGKKQFSEDNYELMLRKLPPYMTHPRVSSSMHRFEVSSKSKNKNDADMDELVERHQRRRTSSVKFGVDSFGNLKTLPSSTPMSRPRKGSILRQPRDAPTTSTSTTKMDPLSEIHEKCYEVLENMKISEILKLLSE